MREARKSRSLGFMKRRAFIAVQTLAALAAADVAYGDPAALQTAGASIAHPLLAAVRPLLALGLVVGLGTAVFAAVVKSPFER